jgi:transposase
MKQTVVGIDIAKRVFQLHWIDVDSGEIFNIALKREKFLAHFVNLPACMIGMEACGGAALGARTHKIGPSSEVAQGQIC